MSSPPPAGKRVKNAVLHRPIVFGSIATSLTKKADDQHTHKWKVFVRGANHEDISYYVKRVIFKLHDSFANPNRTADSFPFETEETGWGEFEIMIKVFFQDPTEKPVTLYHHLRLYGAEDTVVDGKSVIAEHYDEIVFNEPTESFHEILESGAHLSLPHSGSEALRRYQETERKETARYGEAREKVKAEIMAYRAKVDDYDNDLERLKREVAELEQKVGGGPTVAT